MSTATAAGLEITITRDLIQQADPDSDSRCAASLAITAALAGAQSAVISFTEAGGRPGVLARVDCGEKTRVFRFSDAALMALIRLEGGADLPATLTLTEVTS